MFFRATFDIMGSDTMYLGTLQRRLHKDGYNFIHSVKATRLIHTYSILHLILLSQTENVKECRSLEEVKPSQIRVEMVTFLPNVSDDVFRHSSPVPAYSSARSCISTRAS